MMAYPSSTSTDIWYNFNSSSTVTSNDVVFRVLKSREDIPVYKEPDSNILWDEETQKFVYLKGTRWERSFSTKRSALKFLNRMNEGRKKKPDLLKKLHELAKPSPVKKRKRMTIKEYIVKKEKKRKQLFLEQEELEEINEFLGRMGI